MSKRTATSDLNRDNYDVDEPPQEAGVFQQASEETLKNRVIRKARRRCTGSTQDSEGTRVAFAGFSGFVPSGQSSLGAKPSFSFLSSASTTKTTGSNGTGEQEAEKSTVSVNGVAVETSSKQTKDKEYYSKLKGLNQSVAQWISSHVSKNPLCILTPVFKDYEKHLQAIEDARQKDTSTTAEADKAKDVKSVITVDSDDSEDDNKDSNKKEDTSISSESKEESKPRTSTFAFGSSFSPPSVFTNPVSSASNTEKSGLGGSLFGGSIASSPSSATFSFGISSSTPSAGFSFGGLSAKPFTFANVSKPETTESADNEDEPEEPPKPDHKPVSEEGAVYEKRCKVFVKKDGQFAERGVGNLFLKPVCDGEKTQLIVRADTSLGNILLNVLLSSGLPTTKLKSNNVAIVCVPTPDEKPPPVTVLLRVKSAEDADELLATLERHKK